jgi:hypothetical protein
VDEIHPQGRRSYKKPYDSLVSVVTDKKNSEPEKNLVGPIGSSCTTESHPEEQGNNEKYMEYNNKHIGIHIYYRKS